MAAPTIMSDEELYKLTGSWEAAAALRDEQNNALNQYNWSQQKAPEAAPIIPAAPTGIAALPTTKEQTDTAPIVPPVSTVAQPATPAKPSDADIVKFLTDNPNVSDTDIAKIMNTTGLKPEDIARATKSDIGNITSRYQAVSPTVPPLETPPAKPTDIIAPPADPAITAENLTKQILGQNLTNQWSGEGFGSAQANAADMAKILASIGITDIKQFGKITKTIPAHEELQSGENGDVMVTVPEQTITTYGNTLTGQEVPNTYSERQQGNFFGGTFAGKGNTGYGVQFDAQGNPYFYTAGASSNDIARLMQDLGPAGQIALAVATGGLSIPEQLAANAALQLASGKNFKDVAKGTAASYLGTQIPGLDVVKDATSSLNAIDPTKILSTAAQNALISGTKALVTNQDVGSAMLAGAATGGVNGAANAVLNNVEGFKDLTPAQKKIAVNAVTGVITGKPLDQIAINTAIAAANTAVKDAVKSTKTSDASDVIDTLKTAGLTEDLPTGIQLAGLKSNTMSDAGGGGFGVEVSGAPIFAESSKASTVNAPFGYSLMSASEADSKPSGSYYDITANAWFAPSEDVTKLNNLDAFKSDIDLFKSSSGDISEIAASTPQTSDDELANLLKRAGINNTSQLNSSNLTEQDILNLVKSGATTQTGDGSNVPEMEITGERPVPELVITGEKPTTPVTPVTPVTSTTPVIPPPVVPPPVVPPPVVTPPVVKPPVVPPPVVTPPVVVPPTVKSPTTNFTMPQAESIAAAFGMPALANVFYYGKDFGSKKQKLDKKGELEEEEYKPLSVTAPGALGELVEEQKNKENNANDALDLILGKSGESMSVDDLLNIVKGG